MYPQFAIYIVRVRFYSFDMNLDKITKKELAEVIDEQRNTIEKLKSELKSFEQKNYSANENYRREQDKVKGLHSQLRFTHLENIADIKSLQKMLSIYENEAMTHREKAYLGRKLSQVIQNMVDEKIKGLDSAFRLDDDMPF